jgi:Fe-S-cluster containining protein
MGVAEISKPINTPCHALKPPEEGSGCRVYDVRPPTCRLWSCIWLRGGLEGSERPDRVGVVVDMASDGKRIVAREAFPGGFDKPEAQSLLSHLADKTIVFTIRYDGTRSARGPAHMLGEVREIVARHTLKVLP